MHLPGAGLDGPALVGLVLGGSVAWTLTYGFAVWFGTDRAPADGRRVAAVGAAGAVAALLLTVLAAGLSVLVETVSGLGVPVWLSLYVVAGPLGLLLTLAYGEYATGRGRSGDPAQWLGLGAVAGFAVWPAVEYLAVLAVVAVLG